MAKLQNFECDIPGCLCEEREKAFGDGAVGWGQILGVALNSVDNPTLCPKHLKDVMNFVDMIRR